jgi:hypothetical protein
MTLIDRINKFFRGFIVIYNAEERQKINAMYYHSGRKEFYNGTNPYMSEEAGKTTDWHVTSCPSFNESNQSSFIDFPIHTYEQSYNPSTGLPMIGSMDIGGNTFGSSSSYYQDTYYNNPSFNHYDNSF